jgi:hypothetical protein
MLTGVGGVTPPPPLQPDKNTNAKAANTNVRPSERNLISSPVSSGRLSFSWIVLLGKAQARELWDHSKQKKITSCFRRGLFGEPKLGSAL